MVLKYVQKYVLYFAMYNAHPQFCMHYHTPMVGNHYTHVKCASLLFPQKMWAKKCALYMAKYGT